MIENFILAALAGSFLGLFSGMIPGLHTNTLAVLTVSLYRYFNLTPLEASIIISSMVSSHIFSSFIPAALLGAPDEDNSLSVLPAHKMLLDGRGLEAVFLMIAGAASALLLGSAIVFLSMKFFSNVYDITRPYVHFALMAVVLIMILGEKSAKKMVYASLIFFLSGFLGFFVLDAKLLQPQDALLPVLSGLFGVSTLFVSVEKKASIPEQSHGDIQIKFTDMAKFVIIGTIAGLFVGLMPGIGASQAVILSEKVFAVTSPESFLVMLGAVNSADSLFSMSALYTVGNPRSGASVAVERIMGVIGMSELTLLVGSMLLSSGIAAFVSLRMSGRVLSLMKKINYSLLSLFVISFITLLVFLFSGMNGVLVLFTSSCIGILCERLNVKRTHCMGCLLLPTILFFSGNVAFVAGLLGL
ncbi:MAG: tripartite tricarboxylate transporter permease [Candidatus Aenigmatarchaeota archaeon]